MAVDAALAAWARDLIQRESPAEKLAVEAPPEAASGAPRARPTASSMGERASAGVVAPAAPGRSGFQVVAKARKMPRNLEHAEARVRVLHTLAHHELQAMELMAWAILAFPDMPAEFHRGLARIAMDEARHLRMYDARLRDLGSHFGALAVRDWFWLRVPASATPRQFVACVGLGFEGGNLDHSPLLIDRFEAAGDGPSADVQRTVAREEVAHVAFARAWYERLGGTLSFEAWAAELPAPLTPLTMHRLPLAREARRRAGLPEAFLDDLEAYAGSAACAAGS